MNIPALSAFDSRNYKLYFAGQTISLLGTWMQKTAISWIIYSMTHSKFMLGVSIFANLFPSAMLTPFGGVVSDRYNRYRVLLITQILSMLQALTLTLVVYFKNYAVWEIISLSVVLGLINAFDVPARQSLVYELVDDKKNLPNALALNSSMVNLSKLIGPAIAGVAIERFGEVACFGANAFSFIAVISSLLMIRLPAFQAVKHTKNIFGELAEGLTYIRQTPSIRYIIVMLALASLLLLPFTSLMPIYAKDIFKGTASTFGLLDSAIGCGALVGAIFLATLRPGTNLSRILAINTFVFGMGLILFSYMRIYPLALVFIAIGAFGMMSQTTISNTLIQTTVTPSMRGRVISIFVMAYSGGVPIGSLIVSYVSQHIGVQATVMGQGILALVIGTMHVRYLKKNRASEQINAAPNLNEEIAHA
ncbi:MFS transporter [Dyadobacter flavalbus]|uniref:MFS transporter n=1 Tax=Dyadobacter flavalbus TaxID=2579942 RepID=A0A5M8QSY7_9BACT|nr:MFS transporter [Dyadobacter flavalbus]KAA6439367.1 MFS transporter [Dyadobacter flavalbus]